MNCRPLAPVARASDSPDDVVVNPAGAPASSGPMPRFLLAVLVLCVLAADCGTRSGKYYHLPLVRTLTWPGMQFQRLTTREPDLEMCAIAIASLKCVLDDPTVIKLQQQGGKSDVSFVQ